MKVSVKNQSKIIKLFYVNDVNRNNIYNLQQNTSFSGFAVNSYIYSSSMMIYESINVIIMERNFYKHDLEELIKFENASFDFYTIFISVCNSFSIINDYDIFNCNIKTSNMKYDVDNDIIKICDLFLNDLRNKNSYSLYDLNFMSPEEIENKELSESSQVWSICCIIYEFHTTKLPFNKSDSKEEIINNILKCEYSTKLIKNTEILKILQKVFIMEEQLRLNIKEIKKEIEILNNNNYYTLKMNKEIIELLRRDIEIVKIYNIFPKQFYIYSPIYEGIYIYIYI